MNIAELDSKHPDSFKSFYITAEVDDSKVFLNAQLWPEGIYVRWYRPTEKMQNNARDTESVTSVNKD